MRQCVMCVLVGMACLASQGLAYKLDTKTLGDLENVLEQSLETEFNKLGGANNMEEKLFCDCFVRLEVRNARAEWFCSSTSDYECQSLSLEELQDEVQTEAEIEEWKEKRMELLAMDMSAPKPCVCTVKLGGEAAAIEYFCNDMACYMLATEISPKEAAELSVARVSGWNRWRCSDILKLDQYKNNPCCRCTHPDRRPVCRSSHCPVLPCPSNQIEHLPGECCASCRNVSSVQAVGANCPFYHESPSIKDTLLECGCHLDCLKKRQEQCEGLKHH